MFLYKTTKLIYNTIKIIFTNVVVKARTTSGPRATYGPQAKFESFLDSYFYFKNTSRVYLLYNKNNLKISLDTYVMAQGYLTCLYCGPRSQKSWPPLV